MMMGTADLLIALGTSFSVHTGIATYIPTIQVDHDRMTLGKFSPADVPLWGDIGVTLKNLSENPELKPEGRNDLKKDIARRWKNWRKEKKRRRADTSERGINSAIIFELLSQLVPDDAIIAVDVGLDQATYSVTSADGATPVTTSTAFPSRA